MTHKKIIDQFPGHTVYQGDHPGQVYHFFSDTHHCPITGATQEIPGKGALSHRISAFLFSKLAQLHIPNHFLGRRNMRESLMQASQPLPFALRIHSRASLEFSKDFHVPEDILFDPPLIEYTTSSKKYHANDDFLMAMGWVDQEEMDEIHALALRTTHCLQGMLVAWDLSLVEMELHIARSFEDPFMVAGPLAPENLLLRDLRTGDIWDMNPSLESDVPPLTPYIALARRLGVYGQGPNPEDFLQEDLQGNSSEAVEPVQHPSDKNPQTKALDEVSPSSEDPTLRPPSWPKNVLMFPLKPLVKS